MLEAALSYIAEGLPVFPCKADKTPCTPRGLKDATLLPDGVTKYWTIWPQAGIGMVTEGLIVLDFDADKGGLGSLNEMIEQYGKFPDTRVHQTGGGGLHFLFRNVNGKDHRNAVNFAGYQGVDIRANGGYIIAPPSVHASGNAYEVLDPSPIAPCPDWLTSLLGARGKPVPLEQVDGQVVIAEGRRNASLASLAGAMRRQGCSQAIIERALLETNSQQCNPPLPEKDILRIAGSISRYAPEPAASIMDDSFLEPEHCDNGDICDNVTTGDNGVTNVTVWDSVVEDGIDKKVAPKVDEWLVYHKGERFDLDTICRQLDAKNAIHRHSVVKRLSRLVKQGKLEKNDRQYTLINKTCTYIEWTGADPTKTLNLEWPRGVQDGTRFGFDGHVTIRPGHVIVVAGISNFGKTAFALNFLWANMDRFPCTLMGNEYTPETFKARVTKMDWADPLFPSGKPKFELIERRERWKDIIRPDNINIIDWINLGDAFYQIGTIIDGIQSQLKGGLALIVLQKDEGKNLGRGGGFTRDLATLYLSIDKGRMMCEKAKEWTRGYNPNGKSWAFQIEEGVRFHDIREVRVCYSCAGTGTTRKGDCERCYGKGYIEV